MVHFCLSVKAPIFVLRQWHRHRTWSFNEVSARYAELPEEYYVPDIEQITTQSTSNKQMRTNQTHHAAAEAREIIDSCCEWAFCSYRHLISMGIPRELARGVLPVNTYSHMFATVDLHNLFHFLRLRLHEHAQYEIRVYAETMLDIVRKWVPLSCEAFEEYQLHSFNLSRTMKQVVERMLKGEEVTQATSGMGKREWAEFAQAFGIAV